jgi:hemerythrin-like metal-binding protein
VDQATAIEALTDCGAITAALPSEHQGIENALQTLGDAMHAGASPEVLTKIMDMILRFCRDHFASEEQYLREHGYTRLKAHMSAHEKLVSSFLAVRTAISEGQQKATLDASDLLNSLHSHIDGFDRPAYAQFAVETSLTNPNACRFSGG